MVQVIMALLVVAALAYFVLFRTGNNPETNKAQPYAAEVHKAEDVEKVLQQSQQLQQQRIEQESE